MMSNSVSVMSVMMMVCFSRRADRSASQANPVAPLIGHSPGLTSESFDEHRPVTIVLHAAEQTSVQERLGAHRWPTATAMSVRVT